MKATRRSFIRGLLAAGPVAALAAASPPPVKAGPIRKTFLKGNGEWAEFGIREAIPVGKIARVNADASGIEWIDPPEEMIS